VAGLRGRVAQAERLGQYSNPSSYNRPLAR